MLTDRRFDVLVDTPVCIDCFVQSQRINTHRKKSHQLGGLFIDHEDHLMADVPDERIKEIVALALIPIHEEMATLKSEIGGLSWAFEVFALRALSASVHPARIARDLRWQIDAERTRPEIARRSQPDAPDIPAAYYQSLDRLRDMVAYFEACLNDGENAEEALGMTLFWWGGGPAWRYYDRATVHRRRAAMRLVSDRTADADDPERGDDD